jgi:polyisoprenoid-binding protein YceI
MKNTLLVLFTTTLLSSAFAQKYTVEKSSVLFYSHATIEDITAVNKKSSAIFDASTGEIVFSIPIAEFQFAKSLMQEHFNEKYMDTEKYPKSTFKGKVSGFDANATGTQNAKASGKLLIHGVERDVEIPGTIEKSGDKLLFKSKFIVKLEDYKVDRPQLLWQNIAEQVEVTIDFVFKPQ